MPDVAAAGGRQAGRIRDVLRRPRFTVASAGIGLVFCALMGSVFAFTQYLQFALGYSALEAGAAMLPLALGLVMGSGASSHLAGRIGRTRVIAGACAASRSS